MIKLIVVRHAESLGNVMNVIDDNSLSKKDTNSLSEKGKVQAIELAKKLNKYRFDKIIISPLIRTRETLQPYLEEKKIDIIINNLTLERNAGIFAGKPKDAIKQYCLSNNIIDRVGFKPDQGESILEVYKRAKRFLDYLKINFQNKSVLLCGHVNFLGCLDILIENKDVNNFYKYRGLDKGEIKEYTIQ